MATLESGDFGRPRGLSIAAAVRAPKILGSTSLADWASTTMAVVHSGFVRWVFLGFVGFFISVHLALVGFTQTDHPGLAVARRKYNAMHPVFDEAEHAVTPLSVVLAPVFPDKRRRPIELLGKVQRKAAFCKIPAFFFGILVQMFIVYTYIRKSNLPGTGLSDHLAIQRCTSPADAKGEARWRSPLAKVRVHARVGPRSIRGPWVPRRS